MIVARLDGVTRERNIAIYLRNKRAGLELAFFVTGFVHYRYPKTARRTSDSEIHRIIDRSVGIEGNSPPSRFCVVNSALCPSESGD